jgi:hypothetical protein
MDHGREYPKVCLQPSQPHCIKQMLRRNRLGCMLYLIDLLLQSDLQTPSRGNCETFWQLPVPCSRQLWETNSEDAWRHQYDRITSSFTCKSLRLGDLLLLRQSRRLDEVVASVGQYAVAEELAIWCEHADDLSMLLWMALTIEGDGQTSRSGHSRNTESIQVC